MTCYQQNFTAVVTRLGCGDLPISFEATNQIKITFTMEQDDPVGSPPRAVTGLSHGSLPSGYPTPTIASNSITFYDPGSATDDIDLNVDFSPEFPESPVAGIGFHPRAIVKIKPRSSCPSS